MSGTSFSPPGAAGRPPLVADDVEAGQPAAHLRTREVHAVVVIPEGRRPLLLRVRVVLEVLEPPMSIEPWPPIECVLTFFGMIRSVG